jgi:site-specific DNA recombinase
MPDNRVNVAIYTRVSSQEQALEGTSLGHQLDQLTRQCQSQGWQITGIYEDPGYSGKDGNRPGLKRMLADAQSGLFNKVLVYKMDRLARNLRLLLEIEEKLNKSGISFYSVGEVLDSSTTSGRHFIQILGMISEWEREAIIKRTRSGRLQRYKEGKWAGGSPAYGYDYDRDTKKLIINPVEAKVVQRIFKLYSSGKTLGMIADMLNVEHIPPRRKDGKGWRATGVRSILLNKSYKGTLLVGQSCKTGGADKGDSSLVIEIPVPPIITDENEWYFAQRRLTDNKALHRTSDKRWLLQGLIKCGLCGLNYRAEKNHHVRYYNCRGKLKVRHLDGSAKCKSRVLNANWLESEVRRRIEELINDPNRLEPLLKETVDSLRSRAQELKEKVRPINEQLAVIARKKERLADEWVQLNMNADKYHELKRNLDDEEARLKSVRSANDPVELEELETTLGLLHFWESQLQAMAWNTENEDGSMFRIVDKSHQTALKVISLEEKDLGSLIQFSTSWRELLDELQVRLVVFDDRVEVKALFPVEPIYRQEFYSTRGIKGRVVKF